jgi:hypothetical protein
MWIVLLAAVIFIFGVFTGACISGLLLPGRSQ